ncbi:putative dna-directed rna polymerase protein [Phaeoacremonium minimum UCRPA7]|uniref:DNA-directed RNA polymerase n=1 Tax=Phaeoacremonium minimum (strain UCR-PA7) TaxID=1286976 RepID=R8BT27_PHAM7|nr:putative dna-directed rna polymerase protein [Phaeoacremonium minimum UCRPA7]EOO02496.1 putative dna-directed rna polymerase protein [Phaeoacremonium minimum UCRPA7]
MLTRPGLSQQNLHHARRLQSLVSPQTLSRCCAGHQRSLALSRRLLTTKQDLRPWKRKDFASRVIYRSGRNLATALDDYKSIDDIPFDNLNTSVYSPYPNGPKLYELKPFDISSPLVLKDPPPQPPRQRINNYGVPGDIEEMIPYFDACIQVGKLDRASMVLKRLTAMKILDENYILAMHNRYLQTAVGQIMANPSLNKADELHKWYELHIRSQDLPQTAETVALMLKASLATTRGSRLERLVDRYMGMAPGDAGLEVLYMTDILTDQDRARITDICPTYNLSVDDLTFTPPELEPIEGFEAEAETSVTNLREVPEVLSTPQKGMGLRMIKKTLTLFSEIPDGRDIASLSPQERREIQARLERDSIDAAVERWREENEALLKMGLNTSVNTASLNSRLYDWHVALEARLAQELERIEAAEASPQKSKEDLDRCVYGPFLRQSTPSRLAAVTILSALSSLAMHGADKGVPLGIVITQLSKVTEEDIRAQQREKKPNTKSSQVATMRALRRAKDHKPLAAGSEATASPTEDRPSSTVDPTEFLDTSWPLTVKSKLGAALLMALLETAKINVVREHPETKQLITQYQPAFYHANQYKRGKKIGMIMPNQTLVDVMKREPRGEFLARHLPMVAEPEPWSAFDKGGFLDYPSPLVRIKQGERDQKVYTEAAISRGDMDQVLKGLDILGKTAWRINRPVFDVMLEAWNTGEQIANIPPLYPNIPTPEEPQSADDPMQRRIWIKEVKAAENKKSGLHSNRCSMNFQMEIARAFRDQTFYFPHNIDFRGRAYPIPTYLNHMGADHVRGLMCFAQGRELGERGLKWLKVHLANVFGYDKASLSDREAFAVNHIADITDSVEKPLTGNRWWLKAEDPWQCLATCFELKAALDCPDPTKYVSHLPVHQDGTCNGLQHYAALGGDSWGARQVNLEPGDKPADVYSAVADLVKESIAKDLEANHLFAKAVDGKITRKVVKQTVMTNVYGVTFSGAKKQVLKQLDALYPNLHAESGVDPLLLSSYIATKIFKALSTMFRGAHDIQYWLGEIGGRVCTALTPDQLDLIAEGTSEPKKKVQRGKKPVTSTDELLSKFRSTIVWTTPLRMPVVQPYRKSGSRVISTCLQDLVLAQPERSDPVHRKKQLQAFPPNFIHSLDASHMLLSALECDELGLCFAAVHDSFWTHAADIDVMNRVLRDAFIRIHSEDVIGRLAEEFNARYKDSVYLSKVDKSTPVGKAISALRKKGKMSLKQELLLEIKRLNLLKSADPKEVEEGRKIITPASIFEEMSAEADMISREDMDAVALGRIPTRSTAVSSEKSELDDEEDADVVDEDVEDAEDDPADLAERLTAMVGTSHFTNMVIRPKRQRATAREKPSHQIWLPLTFPDIPQKGDFDVTRLKSSEYFFS